MNLTPNDSDALDFTARTVPTQVRSRNVATGVIGWLSDLLTLTKARVNGLVVATTFVGFALHADVLANWWILMQTLAGTGLVAGGAAVANQVLEHSFDREMVRTRNRPLAVGRIRRSSAVSLSVLLLIFGCLWLGVAVNIRTMALAALAFVIYVFAYTPLKRITPACTLVGAVAGALPLLVGWAATDAQFGGWAFIAFAVLFLWQIPHFLAIAWWRRSEYQRAGFRVLPHDDSDGCWTAGSAVGFTVILFTVSLLPVLWHLVNDWYLPLVLILNIGFSFVAIRFLVHRTKSAARALFLASLIYLPVVYVLMLRCTVKN